MSSTHHLSSPTNGSHDTIKLDKYGSCNNTGPWSPSSDNSGVKKNDDSGDGTSIGLIGNSTATIAGDTSDGCYGGRLHGQQAVTGAVDPSTYYLTMAREYCRTLQAATENAAAAAAVTNSLGDYSCPTQQLMTNVMMASMAVAATLMPQHMTTAEQSFNAQCKFQSTAATTTACEHFLNPYSIYQSPFSENQSTSKDRADSSVGSLDGSIDDFHPNTPNSSLVDEKDLVERNENENSDWNSSVNRNNHKDKNKYDYSLGNQSVTKQKPIEEEVSHKKKRESLSTVQYLTEEDEAELLDDAILNEMEHKCDYRENKVPLNRKIKKLLKNERRSSLTGQEDVMESSGDEGTLACCDDEMQQVSNLFSPSSAYYGSPIHDPSLFNKYPMIIVSPQGTIAVYLRESCIVEMTVNRTLRVECQGKFSAASNWQGNTNGILHADARILQQDTRVQCLFGKNKVASFGPQGVIVNMKPSTTAYVVSSTMFKGTTAIPASSLRLPSMDYDFTMAVFYSQPNNVAHALACCQEIIRRNAKHFERQDGSLSVNINGVNIRQDRFGNVSVNCRPRTILLSPQKNTVSVRTHFVDMAIQEDEKAYVKRGVKRVHVSKSGMVVSDGECITAMDHYGRIVSST
uniref:Uncharacterized protein n=1 Tax=Romanomermis culicivorax TaxID=13658 RepID=A0A915J2L3_ROMCU